MRKKNRKQMTLTSARLDHPRAVELEFISQILDDNPTIYDLVLQDLTHGVENRNTGAEGMTAEQVIRTAIIKQTEGFSYEDLAFHIVDSRCYRRFCRIGIADKGFQKSALNRFCFFVTLYVCRECLYSNEYFYYSLLFLPAFWAE